MRGGLTTALDTLRKSGLGCGQIFTTGQRRWQGREVTGEEEKAFGERSLPMVSHASYLINLASTRGLVRKRSIQALEEELARIHRLKIEWTVIHPGAHLGSGEEEGIRTISSLVRTILSNSPSTTGVLFENTSGQGTTLGRSFEQLSMLLELTGMPERTGVCLDTCHAFAAGYDLSSRAAVDDTIEAFDRAAGTGCIKAFHMNDSRTARGSRRDRHAGVGSGFIGLEALRYMASLEAFSCVPGIVETPGSDEDRTSDAMRLAALK